MTSINFTTDKLNRNSSIKRAVGSYLAPSSVFSYYSLSGKLSGSSLKQKFSGSRGKVAVSLLLLGVMALAGCRVQGEITGEGSSGGPGGTVISTVTNTITYNGTGIVSDGTTLTSLSGLATG